MPQLVSYERSGQVATITMDDGKVNALSFAMLEELDAAVAQAHDDDAVILVTGRNAAFSAGFDLKVMREGGAGTLALVESGFACAGRLLSHPRPVAAFCSGHAIAMGVFLLLCADYRLGVSGEFRITANEVAIGLTLPRSAIAIASQRLAPSSVDRLLLLAEVFTPGNAVDAGLLVSTARDFDEGLELARDAAQQFARLDRSAYAATKALANGPQLAAYREAVDADRRGGWGAQGGGAPLPS